MQCRPALGTTLLSCLFSRLPFLVFAHHVRHSPLSSCCSDFVVHQLLWVVQVDGRPTRGQEPVPMSKFSQHIQSFSGGAAFDANSAPWLKSCLPVAHARRALKPDGSHSLGQLPPKLDPLSSHLSHSLSPNCTKSPPNGSVPGTLIIPPSGVIIVASCRGRMNRLMAENAQAQRRPKFEPKLSI
jgi:hypothetical protein